MEHRKDIQGLRAIAVLLVMLFHYDKTFLPGGFIGVDIFFVISGFLITLILQKKKQAYQNKSILLRKIWVDFYISRIKRLAPAYYVLLVCVSLLSVIIFIEKDYTFFNDSYLSALYFSSSQYFANFGNYFAPSSEELPLLHTWSLAIEVQFYFLYPFIIFFVKDKHLKQLFIFLCVILLGISTYFLQEKIGSIYYALYARVPEFLAGGITALLYQQEKRYSVLFSWIGFTLIILTAFCLNETIYFPGITVIPILLGTAFIILGQTSLGINRYLSMPFLEWVGAISYSLYLWHWPVLAFIRYISGSYQLSLIQTLAYWLLSFVLSIISYYLIEQFFRKNTQVKYRTAAWLLLLFNVLAISLMGGRINKSVIDSMPITLTRYADSQNICHGKVVGDCIQGDKNSGHPAILVLGDSHAAMLNPFFDEVGKELGLAFRVVTASSCVTISEFNFSKLKKWAQKNCKEQISYAKHEIESTKNIIVVGKYFYQLRNNDLYVSLDKFLTEMNKKNNKVYLLSDVPSLNRFNPLRNYRFTQINLPTAEVNIIKESANDVIKKLSTLHSNTTYIDLNTSGFFDQDIQNKYYDTNHLHEQASRQYGQNTLIQSKFKSLLINTNFRAH